MGAFHLHPGGLDLIKRAQPTKTCLFEHGKQINEELHEARKMERQV